MNKTSYSSIMLKNVAYKTYTDITVDAFDEVFTDFLELCVERDALPQGDLSYALTHVDDRKHMNVELFIPVSKPFKPDMVLGFRSYFILNQLLQGRIISDNFIEDEIALLEEMNIFAEDNNLSFVSPYYHTLRTNYSGAYAWVDVKAKVYEEV